MAGEVRRGSVFRWVILEIVRSFCLDAQFND